MFGTVLYKLKTNSDVLTSDKLVENSNLVVRDHFRNNAELRMEE